MVGGAQSGISLGMDESTVWGFEEGEVQVGIKSEQNVREISQRRETVLWCSSHKDSEMGKVGIRMVEEKDDVVVSRICGCRSRKAWHRRPLPRDNRLVRPRHTTPASPPSHTSVERIGGPHTEHIRRGKRQRKCAYHTPNVRPQTFP